MLYGEADALNSSYHISYNMLLNMLRVEDADPDFLVKSSFHQFQQEASAPALEVSRYSSFHAIHVKDTKIGAVAPVSDATPFFARV